MSRVGTILVCLTLATVSLTGCSTPRTSETTVVRATEPTPDQQRRLEQAQAATRGGNYDQAIDLFQSILAENPTITQAYVGIGDIYMLQSDYDSAEPAYKRAARLGPTNFDAQYGHGLALQMLGRFIDAVRAYRRALAIDPDNPKANLNIATTYLQMRDSSRALVFAEKAVATDPSNGAAHANLGAIYERLERYEESVDEYIAALEIMGNRPPLMLNLVNVQVKLDRYHEAANTAETLVRIEPSAAAYDRIGWCAFKLRDYDRSEQAYWKAVDLDPGYWPAWNGIGVNALNVWLLSKKRDDDAKITSRDAFRKSLRANPEQPPVIALMTRFRL